MAAQRAACRPCPYKAPRPVLGGERLGEGVRVSARLWSPHPQPLSPRTGEKGDVALRMSDYPSAAFAPASPRARPATCTSAASARPCSTGCSPARTAASSSCASTTPTPSATGPRRCSRSSTASAGWASTGTRAPRSAGRTAPTSSRSAASLRTDGGDEAARSRARLPGLHDQGGARTPPKAAEAQAGRTSTAARTATRRGRGECCGCTARSRPRCASRSRRAGRS